MGVYDGQFTQLSFPGGRIRVPAENPDKLAPFMVAGIIYGTLVVIFMIVLGACCCVVSQRRFGGNHHTRHNRLIATAADV